MNQKSVRQNYIQADVLSATPQKLQLLLVEAAMKNILKTRKFWEEGNISDAFETLTRAQDIVAEILCSLDVENNPDIAKKLASIYVFIFRRLCDAGMSHDSGKLDDAYRVLASERETWKLVCEKFGAAKSEGVVSSVGEAAQMPVVSAARKTPSATAWSSSVPPSSSTRTTTLRPDPSVAPGAAGFSGSSGLPAAQRNPEAGRDSRTGTYQPKSPPRASQLQSDAVPASSAFPSTTLADFSGTNLSGLDVSSGATSALPPQNPMFSSHISAMSFAGSPLEAMGTYSVKPTSQSLDHPLGSVDLVNPLGQSGTLPKLDPMSNPPQNANSPTQATDLGTLQSPTRHIPLNSKTQSPSGGFSWDG